MQFEKEIELSDIQVDDVVTVMSRDETGSVQFKVAMVRIAPDPSLFPYAPTFGASEFPLHTWKVINRERKNYGTIFEDMPNG